MTGGHIIFKLSLTLMWVVVLLTIAGFVLRFTQQVPWVWALSPLWIFAGLLLLLFIYGEFLDAKGSWRRTNGRW